MGSVSRVDGAPAVLRGNNSVPKPRRSALHSWWDKPKHHEAAPTCPRTVASIDGPRTASCPGGPRCGERSPDRENAGRTSTDVVEDGVYSWGILWVMLQIGRFPVCLPYKQAARGGSRGFPFRYSVLTVTAQRSSRRASKAKGPNATSVKTGSAIGGSFSSTPRIAAVYLRSAARSLLWPSTGVAFAIPPACCALALRRGSP